MALNFGGLGFSFAGTDDGAVDTSDRVSKALGGVWNQLQKVGPAAAKAGDLMVSGLGKVKDMGVRAAQGASLAIVGAIESAQNPKLSSAFESQFLGFKKSFKAMTVGMDMSAKEAKKMERTIGGVAFGLNEDMDAAATSWTAFRKNNIDLTKVLGSKGTKGAVKDLIKVTSVYGIEGQQLANVVNSLIHSFGFTEERAGSLADKIVVTGKMFNIGKEAIQAWPGILETLNQGLADFGRKATPEDMERLTTSIVALGGAFREMGGDPAQSIETAKSVMTSLFGERKNIQDMFRGMGGDISEFGQRIMESTGSADAFMKMLTEDPAQFVAEIAKVMKQVEKQGGAGSATYQRLNKTILDTLGPDVAYAVQGNWDQVAAKMSQVGAVLQGPGVKGAFTNLAKDAHVTNITMQEGWDRMMQSMEARLMRISGPLRKEWVKDMRGGFNSTIGVIEKMAAEKGPIGELTQRLLLVKDVGLSALLPAFGRLSPLFGGIATSMLPVMTALGAMGIKFAALGKMALAGGALYGLFYLLKNGPEKTVEALKNLGDTVLTFVERIFPEFGGAIRGVVNDLRDLGLGGAISKMLDKIDWAGIFSKLTSAAKKIGGFVLNIVASIPWAKIFDTVSRVIGGIGKFIAKIDWARIFGRIGDVIANIPWSKVFKTLLVGVKAVLLGAVHLIGSALRGVDWFKLFRSVIGGIATLAGGIVDTLVTVLKSLFYDKATADKTGSAIQGFLSSAFMSALFAIKDIIRGAIAGIWDYVFSGEGFSGKISNLLKLVAFGFAAALILSKKFRAQFIGVMSSGMAAGFGFIKSGLATTGKAVSTTFSAMGRGARAAGKAIGRGFASVSRDVAAPFRHAGQAFSNYRKMGMSTFASLGAAGRSFASSVKMGATFAAKNFGKSLMGMGRKAKSTFMGIGRSAKAAFRAVGRAAMSGLRTVGRGFAKVGRGIRNGLRSWGGPMLMMGLMAAMDQIKERMGTISEIQNSKTIPDFQKTALVGEQAFMGVMDALDQTFGGIPGMIGSALGLSKEDLSNFYFDVQAGFSKFFSALGIGWDNFVDQLKIGWQSFKWTIMDSWEMIKASAGVVWAYIKKGWTSVTTSVGSLFDSFVTGIKEGFYKARDGIEVAITALTEMFMNLAVKLSAIVPEPMVKAAEKWLLDFKKTGGMQGLMIKQNQERLTREKEFQAREDKRKQEKAESDKAVADAEKELVSAKATMAAHQIISVVKSAGRTQKMMKDTATEWNQIEKEKDETKKTADKLRKDAEKRRKRRERQDKQEMKEEDKAAAEKAKVPTAAEQAAAKRRAMLPERFQNMDTSSLDPFMRDTAVVTGIADAVARAAIDKYTGPIDVRVSVEAKGDLKAAAKASKRKGGVTKRRVQ